MNLNKVYVNDNFGFLEKVEQRLRYFLPTLTKEQAQELMIETKLVDKYIENPHQVASKHTPRGWAEVLLQRIK